MNRTVPEITESVAELKSLLHNASAGYKTQRLSMLYLLRSGQAKNRTQVAELLGVHRITIGQWLAAYEAGGLEKLLVRRYPPGRVPLLCEEDRNTLRAELEKPNGFSSYGQITQYIAQTFGVEMSYKAVYALVHDKWGAKLKVARKSHQKKNELASEAFVSDFEAQVEATISENRSDFKSVRLFCQDESRFGLLPVVQRRITLPDVKPVAKVNPIERLWQALKAKLFTRPYGTLAEMQARLTEVLCNYSDKAIAKLTGFSYFLKTTNEI
jgi:transposase